MKLVLDRAAIAEAADVGLSTVDEAIRLGHLKSFLFGRSRKARVEDVRAWLDFLQQQSERGTPVVYRSRVAIEAKAAARKVAA